MNTGQLDANGTLPEYRVAVFYNYIYLNNLYNIRHNNYVILRMGVVNYLPFYLTTDKKVYIPCTILFLQISVSFHMYHDQDSELKGLFVPTIEGFDSKSIMLLLSQSLVPFGSVRA